MQNSQIIDYIVNLGGRRAYEEKRAAKLSFSSLHDYLEDKFTKKAQALVEDESKLSRFKSLRDSQKHPSRAKTNLVIAVSF